MKAIIKSVIIIVLLLKVTSCRDCIDCTKFDNFGSVVGSKKICGDELKSAEKDSTWKCE